MPVGDVFLWQVRSFTVRLSLAVVDRLRAALMRLPASEEHGGILLGQIVGPNTVEVTSCEFFPSAHRKGTLYDLGARERERVAMRARELSRVKTERPVGYFRTHQRPGLFLDQDDLALMDEAFRETGSIALLLRPRIDGPPDAGFFFWENGDLDRKQTHLLFPFDSDMLRKQGRIESAASISAPAPKGPPRAFSGSIPAFVKKYRLALLWAGGAAVSFAGVAALLGTGVMARRSASNPFDLRIARSGQSLRVDWNRNAPALRDAPSATLTIDDGGSQQQVTLDHAELAHGSVQFWPQTEHVVVRMDVTNRREISESVTAVVEGGRMQSTEAMRTSAPSPLPSESASASRHDAKIQSHHVDEDADDTSGVAAKQHPFRVLGRVSQPQSTPAQAVLPPQQVNSPPQTTATNRSGQPSTNPAPTPGAETAQAAPAPSAAQPAPNRPPEHTVAVSVKLEPRPPSEMHKVFGHIPLFGHMGSLRYRGGEDDFQGARPAHSLEPKVPAFMVENLKRPVDIDVLVSIDKSGKVKQTEVLEGAGTGFGSLAADRAAAIQWEPARVGDKPVASQVVAHYHFRRVEREMADAKGEPQ